MTSTDGPPSAGRAGILFSAFRHDLARASAGAVPGAIVGPGLAAGLVLLLVGVVRLIPSAPLGDDDVDVESGDFEGGEGEDDGHGDGLRRRVFEEPPPARVKTKGQEP